MTDQIKPCPFCGRDDPLEFGEHECWFIECRKCEADGPICDGRQLAIAAWNAAPRLTPAERAVLDAAEPVGHLAFLRSQGVVVSQKETLYRLSKLQDVAEALARERRGGE